MQSKVVAIPEYCLIVSLVEITNEELEGARHVK
jgi:hypothetical protein